MKKSKVKKLIRKEILKAEKTKKLNVVCFKDITEPVRRKVLKYGSVRYCDVLFYSKELVDKSIFEGFLIQEGLEFYLVSDEQRIHLQRLE